MVVGCWLLVVGCWLFFLLLLRFWTVCISQDEEDEEEEEDAEDEEEDEDGRGPRIQVPAAHICHGTCQAWSKATSRL